MTSFSEGIGKVARLSRKASGRWPDVICRLVGMPQVVPTPDFRGASTDGGVLHFAARRQWAFIEAAVWPG